MSARYKRDSLHDEMKAFRYYETVWVIGKQQRDRFITMLKQQAYGYAEREIKEKGVITTTYEFRRVRK
jgi:hypothetical protein